MAMKIQKAAFIFLVPARRSCPRIHPTCHGKHNHRCLLESTCSYIHHACVQNFTPRYWLYFYASHVDRIVTGERVCMLLPDSHERGGTNKRNESNRHLSSIASFLLPLAGQVGNDHRLRVDFEYVGRCLQIVGAQWASPKLPASGPLGRQSQMNGDGQKTN